MTAPEITTSRLMLSPLHAGDADTMLIYRADPEVGRYQGWEPATLEDVQHFIEQMQTVSFDTPGTWYQLAVRLRESRELIGDLGVHFPGDREHQVEIGFTIAPVHQGNGYATEAVTGLLDHLLLTMRKHRVFASVDPRNEPSLALLERIGFRREAHFRKSLWFKGEWVDDVVYGLLKSEWVERREISE